MNALTTEHERYALEQLQDNLWVLNQKRIAALAVRTGVMAAINDPHRGVELDRSALHTLRLFKVSKEELTQIWSNADVES